MTAFPSTPIRTPVIERVAEDLFRFALPTPFPVGPVNVYLLLGDPVTLIDTGVKNPETLDALRSCLREAANLAVTGLRQIILTHAHCDHFGLAGTLQEESGATLLGHAGDAAQFGGLPYYQWLGERYFAFMLECGFPEEHLGTIADSFTRIARHLDPITLGRTVEEGDVIEAGGRSYQVWHVPGHSRGQIALHDARDRRLIAGDFLLPRITPNPIFDVLPETEERFRALPTQIASMEKMLQAPSASVCSGHGQISPDHRAVIHFNKRHHGIRCGKIEGFLAGPPRNAREIMHFLFPEVSGKDIFLAISETIGHIDVLEAQGKIISSLDGAVRRFELAADAESGSAPE